MRHSIQVNACAGLVDSLARTAEQIVASLLDPGLRVALVDFPDSSNVGDSAIWLGQRACLRRCKIDVIYASDATTFSAGVLRELVGSNPILINGGGNLGDLWPERQALREFVIREFPDNPIIQLPQSIHFQEQSSLERARRIFDRHDRLLLMVRDERSAEFASRNFRARVVLCPDLAFCLGPQSRLVPPSQSVLWLSRQDVESKGIAAVQLPPGVVKADWLETNRPTSLRARFLTSAALHLKSLLANRVVPGIPALSHAARLRNRTYDWAAFRRLVRGLNLLSSGTVVITDRLHGHILSLLLGIPHVMLDNVYGKSRAFFDTWTNECYLTEWAESLPDAIRLASRRASGMVPK